VQLLQKCFVTVVTLVRIIMSMIQYLVGEIVSYLLLGCLIQFIGIIYFSIIQSNIL
jgi:hypothetical protein